MNTKTLNNEQAKTAAVQKRNVAADPIISLRNVGKIYKTGSGDFVALQNITMDVIPGEFLGIIGKSGAGKTTLLNMISGVSEITSGEVLFFPPGQSQQMGAARRFLWAI